MELVTIYKKANDDKNVNDIVGVMSKDGALVRVIYDGGYHIYYTIGCSFSIGGYAFHRQDGPSRIFRDTGSILFNVHDRFYTYTEEYCRAAGMSDEDTFMWLLRFGDRLPETIEEFYGEGWEDMAVEEF